MYSTSDCSSPSRPSRTARLPRRRRLVVASAALLAAASLLGKAATYGRAPDVPAPAGDERRLEALLAERGWVRTGPTEALVDYSTVLAFRVPGCSGTVHIGLVPLNRELASLFAQAVGPGMRIVYVWRGRISAAPPALAWLHAGIARLGASFGFMPPSDRPVVALAQPPACRVEVTLPAEL